MTTPTRGRSILTTVAAITVTMLVSAQGCQVYKQFNPQGALRIEIPDSATEAQKLVDPDRVQFLMPDKQWRDYIAHYYPDKSLTPSRYHGEGEMPAWCKKAYRTGVHVSKLLVGDEIRWFDTDHRYHRTAIIVPDCQPDNVYITWIGMLVTDQPG